jgi:hypothetical protein
MCYRSFLVLRTVCVTTLTLPLTLLLLNFLSAFLNRSSLNTFDLSVREVLTLYFNTVTF